MASRNHVAWIRYGITTAILLLGTCFELVGQQFVDPQVQSYALQNVVSDQAERALRDFLSQQPDAGGPVDIVSDPQSNRVLVRGSRDVHRAVSQFLPIIDRKPETGFTQLAQAQASRVVKPYRIDDVADLQRRAEKLRQFYQGRNDVRIAADERTRQLIVHAPQDVHEQIAAWMKPAPPLQQNALPPAIAGEANRSRGNFAPGSIAPSSAAPTSAAPSSVPLAFQASASKPLQLRHIDWRSLLQGLRGVQGTNAAVTSPREGELQVTLPSTSGAPVNLQIDQQNQVVQIRGDQESTQRWTRVVQALDQQPARSGERQAAGRLGDAKPDTITQTIAMLGGAGSGAGPSTLRTIGQGRQNWGGDVVNQMFQPQPQPEPQRQPLQLAQAGQVAPGGEVTAVLGAEEGEGGNFLGPVRIEFLEGTDIFIIRGAQRDVDRVMKIIEEIELRTQETEPSIEIYPLQHINSEALRDLINELNTGVLEARLGDVGVTALGKPNAVLLIGRPAGVEAVKGIIAKLDVPAEASARFQVFSLEHLPAVDAERTINFLYNQQTTTQTQQETGSVATLTPRVRVVADFRSNSIVVQGSARDIEEIENLLKQIDLEDGTSANEVRVFPLKNAVAEEVSEVLNETLGTDVSQSAQQGRNNQQQQQQNNQNANTQAFSSRRAMTLRMKVLDEKTNKLLDSEILESGILSNVVVAFNERTNTVVVTAPANSMDLIAEIIRQIDERPSQEAEIRVITIVNGDGQTLLDMLTTLFPQDDNQDGPLVQSAAGTTESTLVPLRFALDPRTNSIIATGNQADLNVVEAILLRLDADDVNTRRTFVYELLYQQASVVADAITQYVLQRRDAYTTIAPDVLSPYQLIDQEVVVVGEDFSNKVIVSVSERYADEVMQLLRDLDKRPDMVMVKCLIAEVDLGTTEEFGVELGIQDSLLFNRSILDTTAGVVVPGFNFNNLGLGGNSAAAGAARDQVAGQALSDLGLSRTNSELGYGGLVLSASNESVSVLLRALQEARRLDVLSRPQVMMLNNQEGEVQVGSSVPFIGDTVVNGLTTTNSVEFIEVGLILNVVPRISPDGLVVMNVLADKSELGSIEDGIPISISASGDVLRQPQINRTRAQTYVSARDGQTVILGGLITKSRSAFERKVPYLADIPLLGKLFRSEGVAEDRRELLIILTPHIVRDDADLNRVNSEEYARMSWCLGNVIETHGDIGPVGPMAEMFEEEVIYSEMAPGQSMPAGESIVPGSILPVPVSPAQPSGAIPGNLQPTPASVPPPLPQANRGRPEDLLDSPLRSLPGLPSSPVPESQDSKVLPAGAEQRGAQPIQQLGEATTSSQGVPTERAVFRFDEIPSFGVVE